VSRWRKAIVRTFWTRPVTSKCSWRLSAVTKCGAVSGRGGSSVERTGWSRAVNRTSPSASGCGSALHVSFV
jgi:hypothetical protein